MNVPTVPGDVLVGAAVMVWAIASSCANAALITVRPLTLVSAALGSVFVYLFGLADNDIVGAPTDGPERPIPAGELSLGAARVARGLCLFVTILLGALANLPPPWWMSVCVLLLVIVAYNRTRYAVLMGLCRALNVLCGAAAVLVMPFNPKMQTNLVYIALASVLLVWFVYITLVTRYAALEGTHPERRPRVGMLLCVLVYLQLVVLLLCHLNAPRPASPYLLLAGAVLLLLLRLFKRLMPNVSAS